MKFNLGLLSFVLLALVGCKVSIVDPIATDSAPLSTSPSSQKIKALAGTDSSICTLVNDAVWCWGLVDNVAHAVPVKKLGAESNVIALDGYERHFCVLKSDHHVYCWGDGTEGQLGDGNNTDSQTLVQINSSANFSAISVGYNSSCALNSSNGKLSCWGREFGTSPVELPAFSSPIKKFVMSFDWYNMCVLLENDNLICWSGGNGLDLYPIPYPAPVSRASLPAGITGLAMSDGNPNICALAQGGVWCWDVGGAPAPMSGLSSGVSQIIAEDDSYCAIMNDKTVKCWGSNDYGELGNNTQVPSATPVAVSGLSGVVSMGHAENDTICAANASDEIYCWGIQRGGPTLGANSKLVFSNDCTWNNGCSLTPVKIDSPWNTDHKKMKSLAGNYNTWCSLVEDAVWCWGLVNGGMHYSPVKKAGAESGVVALDGYQNHFCLLSWDHSIYCWGTGDEGQLGDGNSVSADYLVRVNSTARFTDLSVGYSSACGLNGDDDKLQCWGRAFGASPSVLPALPSKINKFVMSLDWYTMCILLQDDTLYCWNDSAPPSSYPAPVSRANLPAGITDLALDDHNSTDYSGFSNHFCALAQGGVWCWDDGGSPAPIPTLGTGVTKISSGDDSYCAILADKTVKCWGDNEQGELGDGTQTATPIPVTVKDVSDVRLLGHSEAREICAGIESDRAVCWGGSFGLNATPIPAPWK